MMTPAVRRFTFTAHITSSVGWVGAVLAFLAVAVIGFTSDDPDHAILALILSVTATVLSVYKPFGMTAFGQREVKERHYCARANSNNA